MHSQKIIYETSHSFFTDPIVFGHQIVPSGRQRGRLQIFPDLKIVHVLQGKARWRIDPEEPLICAGDFLIFNNSELSYLKYVHPEENFQMEYVHFTPTAAYPNMNSLAPFFYRDSAFQNRISPGAPGYSEVLAEFENLSAICHTRKNSIIKEEAVFARFLTLLDSVYNAYSPQIPADHLEPILFAPQNYKLVTEILKIVNDQYMEPLSAADLARQYHLSPTEFSRLFRQYLGIGFAAYLRQVRVKYAREYIRYHPDCTVLDAAFHCGFNSSSGFYKAYKEVTGKAPKVRS